MKTPLFPARERLTRDGVTMRRMVLADLEEVMAVERRAFAHPWSTELVRRELGHEWSTILLAVEGDPELPLGFVIFWLVHDELHLLNVAVDPPQRRRGLARTLLEEVITRGRAAGCALATLEVRKSNAPAIALYLSLGFKQVGVRPNYYADEQEDALVLVLSL